jgi:hypothetical protein
VSFRRLVIALVVLAVLLVGGDRAGAAVAEGRIAERVPCHTGQDADVSINGVPFLSQAAGGTYDDIGVTCAPFAFGTITDATLNLHLSGVHVALGEALNGPSQVPVDLLTARLFVPYASLAKSSPVPGLALSYEDGHVAVAAPINAPFAGSIDVTAIGEFTDPGDGVTLSLRDFKAKGAELPQAISGLVSAFTKIRILQNAPYGIRIVSATPTPTGVVFDGRAVGVVLRRTS